MTSSAAPSLPPELASLLAERARTFSFAARLLPAAVRQDVVVLYAFFRHLDDLADEPGAGSVDEVRERFRSWRRWLLGGALPAGDEVLARAYRDVAERYAIPNTYAFGMLDGLESDLGPRRVEDFEELRLYCLRVAGTVGLAMCHILGTTAPAALAAAADLGIAMQLTNILRDVGGDLDRDRVYLPADEIARHQYSAERLASAHRARGAADAQFQALMREQVLRARAYYDRGLSGVWMLPGDVRASMLVAGRLYRGILDVIEDRQYDVLRRRAATSRVRKMREAGISLSLNLLWGEDRRARHRPQLDTPAVENLVLLGVPISAI